MKKKIVDWVQQALNALKNQSKKKIVSLGLIGIILLSAVSFSLFDAIFGPKKVTPAELVDIVFEKYDLKYQEAWQNKFMGSSIGEPECYKCNPKPNVKKSDLEQEFAVVGVIRDGYCLTGEDDVSYDVSMDTDKKINDNRFSGNFFSVTSHFYYNPSYKKSEINKKNSEVLKNIHIGDKIKVTFKLGHIKWITPSGSISISGGGMAVEKYY